MNIYQFFNKTSIIEKFQILQTRRCGGFLNSLIWVRRLLISHIPSETFIVKLNRWPEIYTDVFWWYGGRISSTLAIFELKYIICNAKITLFKFFVYPQWNVCEVQFDVYMYYLRTKTYDYILNLVEMLFNCSNI